MFHSRSHVRTTEGGIHRQGGNVFPFFILDGHMVIWSSIDAIGNSLAVKFDRSLSVKGNIIIKYPFVRYSVSVERWAVVETSISITFSLH